MNSAYPCTGLLVEVPLPLRIKTIFSARIFSISGCALKIVFANPCTTGLIRQFFAPASPLPRDNCEVPPWGINATFSNVAQSESPNTSYIVFASRPPNQESTRGW